VRIAAATATAVLASACATVPHVGGPYQLATTSTVPDTVTILHGPLKATVNNDRTACVWATAGMHQTAVIWPAGFTARGNPVTIYDATGKRFAVIGKPVDLAGGQVMSTQKRPVRGCEGLSQSIAARPLTTPHEASAGSQEYDESQVSDMAGIVYTNRDLFGGLWADPDTHVVTIYVPDKVDPKAVAKLLPQLSGATPLVQPVPGMTRYRVGLLTDGPSLATLDDVISQVKASSGWSDFMRNNVAGYGVDQERQTANFQVSFITPSVSGAAVAQFGKLMSLETSYYPAPTQPPLSPGAVRYRIAAALRPGLSYLAALATGTLGGQANKDGTACFWIGNGTDRYAISWPYGYSALGPPLSVYNDKAKLIGRIGQHFSLGGGNGPDGTPNPLGCHGTFNGVWFAAPN
jgi:hypothetical protein